MPLGSYLKAKFFVLNHEYQYIKKLDLKEFIDKEYFRELDPTGIRRSALERIREKFNLY